MSTDLASKRSFILILGCLTGIGAVTIDMSLPAFPEMVIDLATSMSIGQQVIGLFIAGMGLGQIPAGLISDRIGRMPVLYIGISIFIISGIACTVTKNIELLLLSRFIQGLGGSVGIVISRAIVRDISSGVQAARLMSVMVMIFTAGPILAPIVGAFLVDLWGWRAPFIAIVVFGVLMLLSVHTNLQETHRAAQLEHPIRQLSLSLKEFFSHRRSRFGLLLGMLPSAGFIAMITGSSAIIMDIYGFSVQLFGIIFASCGFGILMASMLSRYLVLVHGVMRMIGLGAVLIGIASVQLLIIAWLGQVDFWWLWVNICLFMFGVGILMPNATALALDPVPQIAGVASSLIGTGHALAMTTGSLVSSAMYDGTIRNVAIIMGTCGLATTITSLIRPFLLWLEKIVESDH
jgi:DHA1 family bicyclomycin/chloramphenicol resistance-like MFS transporter